MFCGLLFKYYHVLNVEKAVGLNKPLKQGDRAMVRMLDKDKTLNSEETDFSVHVRIAKVNPNGTFDCIRTNEKGEYLASGSSSKGQVPAGELDAKFLKDQIFLGVKPHNVRRAVAGDGVERDDVLVMLHKSMISIIYPVVVVSHP